MGRRLQGKNITTDELLKSDSEDENYEDRAERSPKRRRMVMASGKKNKKKKGGVKSKIKKRSSRYASEELDEIDLSEDLAHHTSDDEPSQIGPTGRPLRKVTVQKRTTYAEDSDDSIETSEEDSEEEEDEEEGPEGEVDFEEDDDEDVRPAKSRKTGKPPHDPHRGPAVVRLKLGSKHCATLQERYPKQQAPHPRRVTRSSSAQPTQNQQGGKAPMKTAGKVPAKTRGRGISADPTVGTGLGTRRSTRLTQTDEPIAALSNSGKHVILTGLKHPAASDIPEESIIEESKEERGDVTATDQKPGTSAEFSNGTDVPADFEGEDAPPVQARLEEEAIVVDTEQGVPHEDTGHEADDDDDDGPTKRSRRAANTSLPAESPPAEAPAEPGSAAEEDMTGSRRLEQRTKRGRTQSRKADSDEDEYREEGDAEDSDDSMSSGKASPSKGNKFQQSDDERFSEPDRPRSARSQGKRRRVAGSEERHELAAELDDIQPQKRARRSQYARHHSGNDGGTGEAGPQLRARNRTVDYRIARPEIAAVFDDSLLDGGGASTPSRRKGGSALAPAMNLFDTNGPFGGGDAVPVFGRMNVPIDIDSDSSDEEAVRRRNRATSGFGGNVGMTPTGAHAPGLLPAVGQTHNMDTAQAGAPANMGKVTKSGKNALADADPLGISPDVTFDSVGGLDDRIQQLKEMVMLPLMYPEIFKAKKVVPPRGVLFHGPPGTGKTLLARAVASSFTGADGKKVTFYMRKGADCLSKWVGEAERQLRLLFDEARNNQPSIIFFDEIDGLAPVRSSKQEQIHASIVSTLLALMDGMDGRGQVVVIGATNRPDSVDPALRRPGRFDREFYFPLPTTESRRKIIEIHSKGWEPPLEVSFIDQLAKLTKGYGGADLRALCTEAALNAMQRTYPQIYKSLDKLKVDPKSVVVTARDFMMSLKKITPSSERSAASGASPLPEHIEPILSRQLERIKECLKGIFPEFKRLTPLEEAEYEDDIMDAEEGFKREMMMENFESSRVYRPRLLIHGSSGLGQQYLAAAVLHFMETVHVQSFDLGTLLSDATRTPETAIVQFFTEVKRHKPSVVFIPNIEVWYQTLPETALATFKGLVQSIAPNDRVLVFGISESPVEALDEELTKDLFGYSKRDRFELERPDQTARFQYFEKVMTHMRKSPRDFPQDPRNRKKRKLPELERASPPPPREKTEEEKRVIALKDRQLKNHLKIRLNNLMENLKQRYRRFKKPVIDHQVLVRILNPPQLDPDVVASDIPPGSTQHQFRPFQGEDGVFRVEDRFSGRVFFNMDLDIIEERFSNGFYSTPRQFLEDLERIQRDAKLIGDKENTRKANEMLTNAEVYIADVESDVTFVAQCEEMHERERQRAAERQALAERRREEKQKTLQATDAPSGASAGNGDSGGQNQETPIIIPNTPVHHSSSQLSNGVPSETGATVATSEPPHGMPHPPLSRRISGFSSQFQTPQHNSMMTPGNSTQLTHMGSGADASVAVTKVAPMDLSMIVNDASTTTSGKRTSEGTHTTGSQPHSNPFSNPFSNHSNGVVPSVDVPSWGDFGTYSKGDSQLPATQLPVSSADGQSSQGYTAYTPSAPASQATAPPFPYSQPDSSPASMPHPSRIFQIPPPPQPELVKSEMVFARVHNDLAKGSSGYTVEQLEQVNAQIMDHVWRSRANWNRDEVARRAWGVFVEADQDIREMQKLLAASGSFD